MDNTSVEEKLELFRRDLLEFTNDLLEGNEKTFENEQNNYFKMKTMLLHIRRLADSTKCIDDTKKVFEALLNFKDELHKSQLETRISASKIELQMLEKQRKNFGGAI